MGEHEQDPAGRVRYVVDQLNEWTETNERANLKRVFAAVYHGARQFGVFLKPDETSEGVQRTYAKVIDKIVAGSITDQSTMERAIFGTAHFEGINVRKGRRNPKELQTEEAVSETPQADCGLANGDLFECIEEAILLEKNLDYQQALRRYFFWFREYPAVQPSVADVAEMFQISDRTFLDVRKRMIRNARQLRDQRS
ncbi:MAG: hypothetical protein JSS49_02075 [Planctomycetes bacterium]|nr:hypothetical protein [Planctomycetota bacterium]